MPQGFFDEHVICWLRAMRNYCHLRAGDGSKRTLAAQSPALLHLAIAKFDATDGRQPLAKLNFPSQALVAPVPRDGLSM